jgi:hypothetical protein
MNTGVIYFNSGTKCLIRLLVSIWSLRKHYSGPITIITTGEESNKFCEKFKNNKFNINIKNAIFPNVKDGKNSVFLQKASVNDHTPYDISIFLDSDTIVKGDITELFELANTYEFVVPQFSNWTTQTRAIIKRTEAWREFYPELVTEALKLAPAVNCGVFAFIKNSKFMINWCRNVTPGRNNFIPDETGMQVVLHKYKHVVADQIYNCSCKYSDPASPKTKIIHFHGRKHCRTDKNGKIIYGGDIWMKEYEEAMDSNFMDIKEIAPHEDRQLRSYMKQTPATPIDRSFTIVTAVNPPYLEKLKTVLPTWQLKPQLAKAPMIVFHNSFTDPEKELSFIKEVTKREVKLIPWEMKNTTSTRELMLSSFVFGAAAYVNTPYWIKIDGDAYFGNKDDCLLEHFWDYDVVGHKWHYSRPGAWIPILDDWAEANDIDGDAYLDEKQRIEATNSRRYGHKRFASYFCLHKTEFTIEAANLAGDRLPVPSHDTYLWYLATRLPTCKWAQHHFKRLGINNSTDINKLKEVVAKIREEYKI